MKKKGIIAAALVTGIVAAGGLFYLLHTGALEEATATPVPLAPVPVVGATVTQHDVPVYLVGVGTVIAYNTDVVRAQIQGCTPASCLHKSIRAPIRQ
jgi:multidrug efflux system membrane fusion protein